MAKENYQLFKNSLRETIQFISPYELIWNHEYLNEYPKSLNYIDDSLGNWVEFLHQLNNQELWEFDSSNGLKLLERKKSDNEFYNFLTAINLLSEVKKMNYPQIDELPRSAYSRFRPKKKHEIETIRSFFENSIEKKIKNKISTIIDFCGGMGHLSRTISLFQNIPSICIEQDNALIETGKKEIERLEKNFGKKVEINFYKADILSDDFSCKNLSNIFTSNSFSIGLHTCGKLSLVQFQEAIKYKTLGLLNFGCCYLKLDPGNQNEFKISNAGKEILPNFSIEALTLATRSNQHFTYEDFIFKTNVKFFRYALHLFMHEEFGVTDFIGVGDANKKLYALGFKDYVKEKIKYILNDSSILNEETFIRAEKYFNQEKTQKILRKMFLANIIRWKFSRVLEKIILLDRVLFLQENNLEADMFQLFDEAISPRNIGILAYTNL